MSQFKIPSAKPKDDLKHIIDYLITFVGEIEVKTKTATSANIVYSHLQLPSTLTLKRDHLVLSCQPDDTLSVGLIKNTGLRIYNNQLKAFIPANPDLLDLSTITIDTDILKAFKQYQLIPLFQLKNSLLFFCRDKQGKIHLVNRHLLEYLKTHPQKRSFQQEFSVVVAQNIGQFVALFDRGLIPLNFHQCFDQPFKMINRSGMKLTKKTAMRLICFRLDEAKQTFIQTGQELTQIPKKYLAIKVNPDINYIVEKKRLVPQLNVSVFLET